MKHKPKHPRIVFIGENIFHVWLAITIGIMADSAFLWYFWGLLGILFFGVHTAFVKARYQIEALEKLL